MLIQAAVTRLGVDAAKLKAESGFDLSFDVAHRHLTGANGSAVDVHSAGFALRDPAIEFGPGHVQRVADHPEQRCIRIVSPSRLRCRRQFQSVSDLLF